MKQFNFIFKVRVVYWKFEMTLIGKGPKSYETLYKKKARIYYIIAKHHVIMYRYFNYRYNIVFPCMMMSTLTVLVFCLPPDSGEKIALGVTVLLAFSVFMLAIAEKMPETSESIPLIGNMTRHLTLPVLYIYISKHV